MIILLFYSTGKRVRSGILIKKGLWEYRGSISKSGLKRSPPRTLYGSNGTRSTQTLNYCGDGEFFRRRHAFIIKTIFAGNSHSYKKYQIQYTAYICIQKQL
jgi:hypothetical protein